MGATLIDIRRLLVREGLGPVMVGLVLAVGAGIVGRLAVRAYYLLDISAIDVMAFICVPALIVVAAAVACYLPAGRAARVDPIAALRDL